MKVHENVSSGIYPQQIITTQKVFIPKNIKGNIKIVDDLEYAEYVYDEEEWTVEEYIESIKKENEELKIQVNNINEVTDFLVGEMLINLEL